MMQKSLRYFMQCSFFILLGFMGIQQSWALRCLEGSKAGSNFDISKALNTTHTTSVGIIRVTNSNQAAGTLLWESSPFSTTFTCYDDYNTNKSENAYLYLDDVSGSLATLFNSSNLIIGVRFNGREYPIGSTDRINLGTLALQSQSSSNSAKRNCRLINNSADKCADPKTITVNYSLYIKSRGTGKNLSSLDKKFQVFQLDGVGGRNSNGNFQEHVNNMTVNYIECVPILTTQDVDLGTYSALEQTGVILRKTPFTLTIRTEGEDCPNYPFVGRFTSNQKYNQNTLTTSETALKNSVGIQIFKQGEAAPISLEQNIDLGKSNGSVLINQFEAGVLFLRKPTASGRFTSTLNYEVYYK
ncbi:MULTISPECIES: fimbrial protein [unclassified Acinetobacter]|uniref:fimbrial protein n=1 Tax=unclassified Acinetobacter TaxID=196816 RepID=UPI002934A67A|nr:MULTISPECIES: fimbrial protein [unclassified Acinetobacter]WOE30771.1 fimbrial protein [Acinetobacter sp. SAAs470]WOE38964.1 fimbrial protein [Acinetobacter sp. SAAs474]